MRSRNDYLDYLEHSELYHYGVLGMKWGVRKATSYARDINQRKRNETVRASQRKADLGQITAKEHKANRKAANKKLKEQNKAVKSEIMSKTPRTAKGQKASSIYKPYRAKASKEIPSYGTKRGLRTAHRAIATYLSAGQALSVPMAALYTAYAVSPQLAVPIAIGSTAGAAAIRYADHKIGETIFKKTM